MAEFAIRANGLGKKYRRGVSDNGALIDRLCRKRADDAFWALRNVSFGIRHGELVGIIGPNGSGKTTLLKILSRITRPNEGFAEVFGRVGSLLTVGTGFHRDLTGRENIFLNGALLGMGKAEIKKKFDEIVDFSGVREFLDTPIKRYSSGMLVRLGFAVAAHLEQEIVLVDEVLAVGDAAFQRKCIAKIGDVARRGQTVILVSHEMPVIIEVCDAALWLDGGSMKGSGKAAEIVAAYNDWMAGQGTTHRGFISLDGRTDGGGNGTLRLTHIRLLDHENRPVPCFKSGQFVKLAIGYQAAESAALDGLTVGLTIFNRRRLPVAVCESPGGGPPFGPMRSKGEFLCEFPRLPLMPGQYSMDVICRLGHRIIVQACAAGDMSVVEGAFFQDRPPSRAGSGDVFLDHRWVLRDYQGPGDHMEINPARGPT